MFKIIIQGKTNKSGGDFIGFSFCISKLSFDSSNIKNKN